MMPAAARERDIDRAWRQHDPDRARVPFAARRAAQAFRDGLTGDAEKIVAKYESPSFRVLLHDWALKSSLGRVRTLSRIEQALTPASVDDLGGELRMLRLEPRGQMIIGVDDP